MLGEAKRDPQADDALVAASKDGEVDGVRAALAAGADVHARDDAALRLAAYTGHAEVVRMLLDAGARWNRISATGLEDIADMGAERRDPWLRDVLRAMIPED